MSDLLLWSELRKGNQKALASIYGQYFQLLYNYGVKFTKDSSTVEDCIQELFVELWNSRERLSETDSIKPYLLVSLKRKILKTISKNRKTDLEIKEYHFDAELDIEAILVNDEDKSSRKKMIEEAFNSLSNRQREIVFLKYYVNMDYESIAVQMDLNYQSARNLLHRALSKLSKHIILTILFFLISEYIFLFFCFS